MNDINIKEVAKLFIKKRNIRLLCHIHPDGDTLGSAFGLKHALEAKGSHKVTVVCEDEVPKRLIFLTEGKEQLGVDDKGSDLPELVCSIDCSVLNRVGNTYDGKIDLKIDHHKDGDDYAGKNYTDSSAAATGEIIYMLIRELEELGEGILNKESATALYAALSSDTGSFKYSNVTSRTMRIAAELIDEGADHVYVSHRLFGIKTYEEIAAEKIMLSESEFYIGGKIAFFMVTNDMKKGMTDDAFSDTVSKLREIEGVELSVTLRQDSADPKSYKISMRSGEKVSASELCRKFGGGGHERAAGAVIKSETPEVARQKVLELILNVSL